MRSLLIYGLLLAGSCHLQAQQYLGYHSSNYAGINSISTNPANIVDSRLVVDVNLISGDFGLTNNYVGLSTDLFRFRNNPLIDSNFSGRFQAFRQLYLEESKIKQARFFQSWNMQGPSFAFQLGKNAFAFTTAVRQVMFMDNMEPVTADFALAELKDQNVWNLTLDNRKFNLVAAGWTEIGLAYGREVFNNGEHYVKAAVHPRLLLAAASAYFYADRLYLNFRNNDTLNVELSDIRFGFSNNLRDSVILERPFVQSALNRGSLGIDLGAVYEWRPRWREYRRADDSSRSYRHKNQYLLKVGLTLQDLGFLRFDRGTYAGNFNGSATDWDLNTINIDGVESFGQLMRDTFNMTTNREPYRLRLPTTFGLQVDYNVWKGFYVNYSMTLAVNQNDAPQRMHGLNRFSLTPRYELRWLDVALPFSVDGFGNWQSGFALRLGPAFFGSSNLFNFVGGNFVRGVNFYGGIKVPIAFRPRKKKDPKELPIEQPKKEEPKPVEEPKKEEPKPIEEPKKEEPKPVEEPKKEEPKPVEEPKKEEPKPVEEPKKEEPKPVEEPKKEEPKLIVVDPLPKLEEPKEEAKFVYEPPYYKLQEKEFVLERASVFFETGSANISPSETKVLDQFAEQLIKDKGLKAVINGYADNVGANDYNGTLSQRRADAAKRYLVLKGVSATRITTSAFGASNFVSDNKTEAGRRQNRRVEMIIVAPK